MAYSLSHSYVGDAFVSDFNWFNGDDPSNGFVRYQSQPDALEQSLYSVDPDSGAVILAVDSTNTYPEENSGRPSVRLESKEKFNRGLFIGDFAHMPPSVCGVWPAFWMYGPAWPENGEIDIIEGGSIATRNLLSAHTTEGCSIPEFGIETTGEAITLDCESPGDNDNVGCTYVPNSNDTSTYGDTFNAVDGGVYALEWTSEDIRIWHWPRNAIPRDIVDKEPAPESWGLPAALFGTESCDPDTYFRNMSIVVQTNFCGDYAGPTWDEYDTCSGLAGTCVEYVANNPEAFENAYWEVNYIDVYQRNSASESAPISLSLLPESSSSEELTTTTTLPTTTTTTVTVYPSQSKGGDPASIGGLAFLGCVGSDSGFRTFEDGGSDDAMTPEMCVERCESREYSYAGVHDDRCLCADEIDGGTRAVSDRSECDLACPGDETEFCGGFAGDNTDGEEVPGAWLRFSTKPDEDEDPDVPEGYLISLYGAVGGGDEVPSPAPPMGEDDENDAGDRKEAIVIESCDRNGPGGASEFTPTVSHNDELQTRSRRPSIVPVPPPADPSVTPGPAPLDEGPEQNGPTSTSLPEVLTSSEPVVEPTSVVEVAGSSAVSFGWAMVVPVALGAWNWMVWW